jgi:DNA polymerase III delta subunit
MADKEKVPQVVAVLAPAAVEVREIVDGLVREVLGEGFDPYALVRVEAASTPPAELQPHLMGASLMAEDRVVVVGGANDWTAAQQRDVVSMLRQMPRGTTVILTVVGEAATGHVPLVSDLMQYVESQGKVVRRQKVRKRNLPEWIGQRAAKAGVTLDIGATEELVNRVGDDQDRLDAEIEKLATYAGRGERVMAEDVAKLVPRTAEASVFALVDAITEGKDTQAQLLVREYLPPTGADDAVIGLIGMLARHLRLLWQVRAMGPKYRLTELDEVPEEFAGKFPSDPNVVAVVAGKKWMAERLMKQAARHTEQTILAALRQVYAADLTIKGVLDRRLPPDAVAELLVAELCRLGQEGRRARA